MSSNKLLWLVWLPVPFRADIPKLNFNFTVMLPEIAFTGKYSLKMRLLLLNIQGRGDVNGTLGKITNAIGNNIDSIRIVCVFPTLNACDYRKFR